MTGIAPVLGVLAGAIGVTDTVPYVRDILHGKHAAAPGDVAHLGRPGHRGLTVPTSRRRIMEPDHGRHPGRPDEPAVAGAGVIGWILADQPFVATACVVATDLIGAAMMVPKTHRDPESETLVTFALASLGGDGG